MIGVGDTFIIRFEVLREVQDGETYQGQVLSNRRHNLFWVRPVGGMGVEILICADQIQDEPLLQALEELNRK